VLITESPEGGWGINGHANTSAEMVAAARAQIANQGQKKESNVAQLRQEFSLVLRLLKKVEESL